MVYGEFIQEAQLNLSLCLKNILPEKLDCLYAVNSGTEANEAAIKLCRAYTGRSELISFHGSYHGSTNGSLSISGNENKKRNFRPLLPDVNFIRLNETEDLKAISTNTAGVFLETIQGDAGVQIPSQLFMTELKKRCEEVGALLILDEVQCGLGRTGKNFAFEHYSIHPDILTLGKALGGGLPIGALIANKEILDTFKDNPALGHITTFGGHPLSCAAAAGFCNALVEEINFEEVEKLGELLGEMISKHPAIISYRRIGMMLAFDMKSQEIVSKVVESCMEKGVLIFWFLSHPNSFRLSPPLNISKQEIIKAATIIYESINESIS
jgi:acetylornithine/N-succinyldiaminopimelate aminotransferase